MKRVFLIALAAMSAAAQTTITDTLRIAPGNGLFAGRMTITAPEMVVGSTTYAAWTQSYAIASGAVSVSLMPNDTALPAGTSYRVQYYPSTGALGWAETWYVPTSSSALKITDVKTRSVTSPNVARLPLVQLGNVATSGKILMSDGTKWDAADPPAPVASGVRSFFSGAAPIVYDSATGAFSCPTCGSGAWGSITGTLSAQSDLQAALDAKAAASHAHTGVYEPVDATIIRSGTSYSNPSWITSLAWSKITGAPSTYAPSTHAHAASDVTSGTLPLARGGTNNATWTAGRCVQVSSDGTKLEVAAEACGSGTGGTVSAIQAASASFTSQTSVSLAHNFNSLNQVVACYNGSAAEVKPSSVTLGLATTTVAFSSAQTGSCTVLGGTGLYSQSFTAQTSVTLSHGLGTQAILGACYDSSSVLIEAASFAATSTSAATVTFEAAQTGSCVVAAGLASGSGGGSGDTTAVANSGSGAAILKTSTNVTARSVVGTSPIVVTQNTDDVTISCPTCGSGGGTVATGLGLTGDGSSGDPVRIDASGGAASQVLYSANLTGWGTVAAAACGEKNITATGVQAGDAIAPIWPLLQTGLVGMMYATENLIVVRLCNVTAAGIVVGDGLAFGGRVIRGF